MPEDVGFYDDMTGPENLIYTARLNGIPDKEARRYRSLYIPRRQLISRVAPHSVLALSQ